MMTNLFHYTAATVFLFIAAVTYEKTFVAWIDPGEVKSFPIRPAREVRGPTHLDDLFVDGSWQRGRCKSLITNEMTLLYQQWEQTSTDQLKVWPVTVIMGRGLSSSPEDEPIVIEAERGATIKFTKALEALSGSAPPVERGQMIGQVHLYRQATDGHSIDMTTSNIAFDHRRIWTTDTIDLQVGQAHLVGRDLTFYLGNNPIHSSGDAKSVLDRMELIYLDDLFMPLEKSSAATSAPVAQPSIAVRCAGRLEYDFAADLLKMRDTVSLVHQDETGSINQFDCQMIHLSLLDPTNELLPRDGPLDWIGQIVAEGDPAIVRLGSYDAELVAEQIQFDAKVGEVVATGSRGIRLRVGQTEASLANLTYRFAPEVPEAVGQLDVDGPGIVNHRDTDGPLRKLQWQRGFSLRPDPNSNVDPRLRDMLVFLDRGVQAWFVDGGEFRADDVQGRLLTVPNSRTQPLTAGTPNDGLPNWVPDQFDIQGNVRIDTSAIDAETDRMQLFFVESDPASHPANSNRHDLRGTRPNATPNPSTTNPLRQWVSQPAAGTDDGIKSPVARPRPKVIGDKIIAQLRRDTDGLTAKQLKVAGNVRVEHTLEANGRSLATTLTGQLLQLIDQGGEDVLQLGSGPASPARFDIGDGFFVGPEIQIRPSQNVIRIKDAGEFQFPSDAIPSGLGGPPGRGGPPGIGGAGGPANITWTRPPYCRWQGHMLFDGSRIELTDGVDITGALLNDQQPWDFTMTGDRLEVDLWDNIDLQNLSKTQAADIRSITLFDSEQRPVFVQAIQRSADGVLEAKHLLHADSLTLIPADRLGGHPGAAQRSASQHVATIAAVPAGARRGPAGGIAGGTIVGQGPGWYRAWMPEEDQDNDKLSDEPATAMIGDRQRTLSGIHLTYNDEMSVDLAARRLVFHKGVRVGKRPVQDWEEIFDAQVMSVLKVDESTLDCDRLEIAMEPQVRVRRSTAKQPMAWEMNAIEGVVFRTRSDKGLIEGTASRSSYSSSKDIFTATGTPGRPATIRRRLPDGTPQFETAIPSIAIRLKTLAIEAQLGSIGLSPPSNLTRPPGR